MRGGGDSSARASSRPCPSVDPGCIGLPGSGFRFAGSGFRLPAPGFWPPVPGFQVGARSAGIWRAGAGLVSASGAVLGTWAGCPGPDGRDGGRDRASEQSGHFVSGFGVPGADEPGGAQVASAIRAGSARIVWDTCASSLGTASVAARCSDASSGGVRRRRQRVARLHARCATVAPPSRSTRPGSVATCPPSTIRPVAAPTVRASTRRSTSRPRRSTSRPSGSDSSRVRSLACVPTRGNWLLRRWSGTMSDHRTTCDRVRPTNEGWVAGARVVPDRRNGWVLRSHGSQWPRGGRESTALRCDRRTTTVVTWSVRPRERGWDEGDRPGRRVRSGGASCRVRCS